jgi:hypothetical protein
MMRALAWLLARPAIVDWLIRRAQRTPYLHISSADGRDIYMYRYWLFNPYPDKSMGKRPRYQFPISIRLHRIMRADQDRHLHDHPWNARTFILRGCYIEHRPDVDAPLVRVRGDTAKLRFGEYHRIAWVSDGGVWTLFVTGKYRGTWGFLVDGVKVKWREYLDGRE